ncbi:MAG TPA: FAD-dependent oxidoreductase, partial [Rhodocyclaceae bacterium]
MNAPFPKHGGRIAVVGSGIAGLSTAWLLSQAGRHAVLFEAESRLGGHSNTVNVTVDGISHPVDTGFLVYNERTYPNLIALFDWLGVPSVETEMSFSVSLSDPDLEWAGSSLATVFGQSKNLVRPAFWRMLTDILRFNRETTEWLARPQRP